MTCTACATNVNGVNKEYVLDSSVFVSIQYGMDVLFMMLDVLREV